MASGAFLNPRTVLLLTPLVSSTCCLWFATDEELFLRLLTLPETREHSDALLPAYFRNFVYGGIARVLILLGVTAFASIRSISVARPLLQSRGSLVWYAGAATLAAAHLAYGPAVAWRLQAIVDDERASGRNNVDVLGEWLRVNFVRMWTTDLGAWACAFVAVTKTLSVA